MLLRRAHFPNPANSDDSDQGPISSNEFAVSSENIGNSVNSVNSINKDQSLTICVPAESTGQDDPIEFNPFQPFHLVFGDDISQ